MQRKRREKDIAQPMTPEQFKATLASGSRKQDEVAIHNINHLLPGMKRDI